MVTNWTELLKILKIESNTAEETKLSKLECWYLENISKEPLFDGFITLDKKLTLLNRQISDYFNSVGRVPIEKSSDKFAHLDGMSAIQYSAKKGYDVYLNTALKENPTAVKQATSAQLTPLHLAALYGHQISCSILLGQGANPKAESKLGQIPLDFALILMPSYQAFNLSERKRQIFATLVEAYPGGIFHRDKSANTIAHLAVENNFPSVIKKLVQENPKLLEFKNNSSHTPLHTALLNNKKECIDVFQLEDILSIADKEGRLPIHYAAMYSDPAIVQAISRPMQLDSKDTNLRTPIMLAALQGNFDNVKLLVAQEADVTLTDKYGLNLFHHAVMSLNLELVKWLVENTKVNINQQDQNGRTPLMGLLNEDSLNHGDLKDLIEYLVGVSSSEELVDHYGKSLSHYLPDKTRQHVL